MEDNSSDQASNGSWFGLVNRTEPAPYIPNDAAGVSSSSLLGHRSGSIRMSNLDSLHDNPPAAFSSTFIPPPPPSSGSSIANNQSTTQPYQATIPSTYDPASAIQSA